MEDETMRVSPLVLFSISIIFTLIPTFAIWSESNTWEEMLWEEQDCDQQIDDAWITGWTDKVLDCGELDFEPPFFSYLLGGVTLCCFIPYVSLGLGDFFWTEKVLKSQGQVLYGFTLGFSALCSLSAWVIFDSSKHVFYDTIGDVGRYDMDAYVTPEMFWCNLLLILPYPVMIIGAMIWVDWAERTSGILEIQESDSPTNKESDVETVSNESREYLELPIYFHRRKPWVDLCEVHGFITKNQTIEKMSRRLNAYNKLVDYRHQYGTKITKRELVDIANFHSDLVLMEEKQAVKSIMKRNPSLQNSEMSILDMLRSISH